jgi:hypothetical protein
MSWDVENTDEFATWWDDLSEAQQENVAAIVTLLMEQGPKLPFPYSSDIQNSRHDHMRELRVQSAASRFASFMLSIRDAPRFFCSVATRPVMTGFTIA